MKLNLIEAYTELKAHESYWTFDNTTKDYWRILKDSVENLGKCGNIEYAMDIAKYLLNIKRTRLDKTLTDEQRAYINQLIKEAQLISSN